MARSGDIKTAVWFSPLPNGVAFLMGIDFLKNLQYNKLRAKVLQPLALLML